MVSVIKQSPEQIVMRAGFSPAEIQMVPVSCMQSIGRAITSCCQCVSDDDLTIKNVISSKFLFISDAEEAQIGSKTYYLALDDDWDKGINISEKCIYMIKIDSKFLPAFQESTYSPVCQVQTVLFEQCCKVIKLFRNCCGNYTDLIENYILNPPEFDIDDLRIIRVCKDRFSGVCMPLLHDSVYQGNDEVVKVLLREKTRSDAPKKFMQTPGLKSPLVLACLSRSAKKLSIMQQLIKAGFSPCEDLPVSKKRVVDIISFLMSEFSSQKPILLFEDVIISLIDAGIDPNTQLSGLRQHNITLLQMACQENLERLIRTLVWHGSIVTFESDSLNREALKVLCGAIQVREMTMINFYEASALKYIEGGPLTRDEINNLQLKDNHLIGYIGNQLITQSHIFKSLKKIGYKKFNQIWEFDAKMLNITDLQRFTRLYEIKQMSKNVELELAKLGHRPELESIRKLISGITQQVKVCDDYLTKQFQARTKGIFEEINPVAWLEILSAEKAVQTNWDLLNKETEFQKRWADIEQLCLTYPSLDTTQKRLYEAREELFFDLCQYLFLHPKIVVVLLTELYKNKCLTDYQELILDKCKALSQYYEWSLIQPLLTDRVKKEEIPADSKAISKVLKHINEYLSDETHFWDLIEPACQSIYRGE